MAQASFKDVQMMREAIRKIAAIITRDKNIRVTQQGIQAFVETSTKTGEVIRVNVPSIPDNCDQKFLVSIQGFLDHELGHVLFTDHHATVASIKEGREVQVMTNIVEDVFVERQMTKRFIGSRRNLRDMYDIFTGALVDRRIKDKIAESPNGQLTEQQWMENLLPSMVRAYGGQGHFESYMKDKWQHMPNIKKALDAINLSDLLAGIKSSMDSLEVARKIVKALTDPQEGEGSGDGQDSESGGKSDKCDKPSPGKSGAGGESDQEGESDDSEDDQGSGAGSSGGGEEESDPQENSPGGGGEEEEDSEPEQGEDEQAPDEGSPSEGDEEDSDDAGQPESDGSDDEQDSPGEEEEQNASGDEQPEKSEGDDSDDEDSDGAEDDSENDQDADTEEDAEAEDDEAEGDGDQSGKDSGDQGDAEDDGSDDGGGGDEAVAPESPEELDGADKVDDDNGVGAGMKLAGDNIDIEDFDDAMADLIGEKAIDAHDQSDYTVFTRDYDWVDELPLDDPNPQIVEKIADQVQSMVSPMMRSLQRAIMAKNKVRRVPGKRSGRIKASNLHRLISNDDRIFYRKEETKTRNVAISLVVDCSGSMHGPRSMTAATAATALAEVLDRLNVKFEALGFTTGVGPGVNQHDIAQEYYDQKHATGRDFSRVYPLVIPIFKSFREDFTNKARARIAHSTESGLLFGANVDGESLEIAAARLLKEPTDAHMMIVLSDGQPAGAHGAPEHLKKTVEELTRRGVNMVGIGIQSNAVKSYYPKSVVLKDIKDLPTVVIGEVRDALLKK